MFAYIRDTLMYFLNQNSNIIYFDFETTGLNPYHEKIIDFCFLKEPLMNNCNESEINDIIESEFILNDICFASLVDPQKQLSSKIIEITKISNEMVKGKPFIEDMVESICEYINKDYGTIYLLAHNCHGFDQIFLERTMRENEIDPQSQNWKFIDTLLLAKKLKPEMYSYSLKTLCKYYNITEGTHRALSDCVALRLVYMRLLDNLSKKYFDGLYTRDDLLKNPQIVYEFLYLTK